MDLTQNLNLLIEGIRALRELSQMNKDEEKTNFKSLFGGEKLDSHSRMKVMMSLYKIPEIQKDGFSKSINIRVPIPHNFVDEEANVLLITRDAPGHKALRSDEQPSIHKYQDLLREHGALDLITRVMPLKQLKTEYKEFEAKTSLCRQFDIVLCDEAIFRRVPLFLGGVFYKRGKLPIPINLSKPNLRKEIQNVLSTIHLHMDLKGDTAAAQFGRFGQSDEELAENLEAFVKAIEERIPGKWQNLRSLHIKTRSSKAMPIYISVKSANEIDSVSHPNQKKSVGPVSGFLDTIEKEVHVYPDYSVKLRKSKTDATHEFIRTVTEKDFIVRETKNKRSRQLPVVGNIVRRKALKERVRSRKPDEVTEASLKNAYVTVGKKMKKNQAKNKSKKMGQVNNGKKFSKKVGKKSTIGAKKKKTV